MKKLFRKKYLYALVGLVILFLSQYFPSKIPFEKTQDNLFIVKRVIDGDTIELENGQIVRYIGVDSPELHHPKKPVQCFGQEALEFNKKLVEGKEVRLEKDVSETDRYKRLLRYVYVGDIFINQKLVEEGFASVATFPPDVKYVEVFLQAQEKAREKGTGLWSICKVN